MFIKLVLFCAVSICGYYLIHTVFENDRFFSHLSTIEREMSFRTEAGFYYSYFKTMVEAPSFLEGWRSLVNDTGTEYPSHINTLQRFNVYPEVVLGAAFRIFTGVLHYRNETHLYLRCYNIRRGDGLSNVQSCSGPADLSVFYTNAIFGLAGLHVGIIFLFGSHLAGNVLGGILSTSCYFFNYFECSRVHGIPPLRESFSFPFLTLQTLLVSEMLKNGATTYKRVFLVLVTVCYTLPWQFTQFVLLTQTLSLFAPYLLSYIQEKQVTPILDSVFIGYVIATVFQFLNTMLISSLYISAYIAFKCVIFLNSRIKMQNKIMQFIRNSILFLVIALTYKISSAALFQLSDDAHIFNIFKSKFSDFRDFHTLLYICADAFDFIGFKYFFKCSTTLLLPVTVILLARLGYIFLKDIFPFLMKNGQTNEDKTEKLDGEPEKEGKKFVRKEKIKMKNIPKNKKIEEDSTGVGDSAVSGYYHLSYHVVQLGCYFAMAVMIMRLKLFFTPYMAILCSLVASDFVLPISKFRRQLVVFALVGAMSIGGYKNLYGPLTANREYTNVPQEQLLDWVIKSTPQDAVFGGPMALNANLRLTTGRNIVNHPHYEDSGLRERTKLIYQIFSRKDVGEVYGTLKSLEIEYVVLDKNWCIATRPRQGCSLPEIWDLEDTENVGKATFCDEVVKFRHLFSVVFSNDKYRVLKLA